MKVAVIGAGVSGLTSIKCCLEEGLAPTCFERSDDIGGLWRFSDNIEDGRGSIYQSVVSNTSKELMCYSDFPFPENYPNFIHNSKMLEYHRKYAEHFNLLKYIQFKTVVISVKKCKDFESSGQWYVTTEKNGKQETTIFDAVMVCSGHHTDPYYPLESYPGIKLFKGKYFHSREYKNSDDYKGKRIVIVGMGNSAADIAVELSRTASQVFLSTRRGAWVISRVFDHGYPWDICFDTRFETFKRNSLLPMSIVSSLTEKKMNEWFCHANYGLQPVDRTQFKEPLLNDELPSRITCGFVLIKPSVSDFTETGIKFNDGSIEENIDVVIFATGYSFYFPFLDESVIKMEKNTVALYKHIVPPTLEKPTLGIIGLIQPLGPIMPTSELQARWLTRVFKGLCPYPPLTVVMDDIRKKHNSFIKRFGTTRENRLQVDYVEYVDELASDIGVKPNIFSLFLSDPLLAMALFFGPCTPTHFRLVGPGNWSLAREMILTTWDRIIKPTKTRVVNKGKSTLSFVTKVLGALCVLAVIVAMVMYKY
ncbi:dimethylaniline monooxygenase [N-oxide-forming] 2-like isoform X1 [Bufo gargarizans]|uniref:dimethylaniline monooxygenase [N-oxide-forming] 2-like isoform X1 n=1 Tax=Bufo gargarizans TaxID=30331 RepID=UPI001CF34874|nr:dimethylaniline monooxygenase [N-oxide-forming] 2-like isoform X1 [Bufo gargarizans]